MNKTLYRLGCALLFVALVAIGYYTKIYKPSQTAPTPTAVQVNNPN